MLDKWKNKCIAKKIFDRVMYLHTTYYSIIFKVFRGFFKQHIGIWKWYNGRVKGDRWWHAQHRQCTQHAHRRQRKRPPSIVPGIMDVHQLEIKSKRNQLEKVKILQATNANIIKRLKNRQELWVIIRAGRTAKVAIKQIAFQEFQVEKIRIKKLKKNVMKNVLHKLQTIKQT